MNKTSSVDEDSLILLE